MTEFSWKHKIIFGVIMAFIHTGLLFVIQKITGDVSDLKSITVQGLIMGVFFVLFFPYLIKHTAKKLAKKVDILAKDIIVSPEEIIYDGGANQMKGRIGIGGKLFITNERIVFISHKFNTQTGVTIILPENVTNIKKVKLSRIFNTGILITLDDASTYKFVVNKQEEWFSKLNSYIQAA